MKRAIVTLVLLLLLVVTSLPAIAQELLVAGEAVEGEITNDAFSVSYLYEGTAGEIIIVDLWPVDILADYDNPAIAIRLNDEEILRYDGFGNTTIVTQLPEDGMYTIVATRRDDAEGTSVGEYTLLLRNPTLLTLGEPVSAEIDSELTHYYYYDGKDDFMLSFARDGDFAPQVAINTVDTSATPGRLEAVAAMAGVAVSQGNMGIIPGSSVYVITVGEPPFSINFGNPTAEYALGLYLPEKE